MNVLFLTHSFPRFPGDAPGSFLLRLAVALGRQDVNVHVIAPSAPGLPPTEEIEGITVERFRYAPHSWETLAYTGSMAESVAASWTARLALLGFMGAEVARALAATRRFPATLVHSHWWFPSGVAGQWAARMLRVPLITTMHGTDVRLARSVRASRGVFRSVVRSSARVTTVSSWLASEVRAMAPASDPVVAPMPVATDIFTPGATRESARFLFAGRLNRQKGLDHLLRAFAAMKRLAMLDVVGDGPDSPTLRLLASQLGISDRVVWHGQLSRDGLLDRYRAATAVVVPSIGEGLGLVAAEAMLCEAPVIAFRSGGLVDIVREGVSGVLVNPGDAAELAAAMDRVLASPVHAAELGRAGRAFVLAAFSPESAATRYAELYREAHGKRPS